VPFSQSYLLTRDSNTGLLVVYTLLRVVAFLQLPLHAIFELTFVFPWIPWEDVTSDTSFRRGMRIATLLTVTMMYFTKQLLTDSVSDIGSNCLSPEDVTEVQPRAFLFRALMSRVLIQKQCSSICTTLAHYRYRSAVRRNVVRLVGITGTSVVSGR
jgi:hypothetical protein